MVPFHLQIELNGRLTTFMVEQLERLADDTGFMRYQVSSFNQRSVIVLNVETELTTTEKRSSYSEDDTFSTSELSLIAAAISEYQTGRQLCFDPHI